MQLITQQQLADALGVSLQVINNWTRRGKIATRSKYGKNLIIVDEFNPIFEQFKKK
jgi:predicted site-specific integrase-resolvase